MPPDMRSLTAYLREPPKRSARRLTEDVVGLLIVTFTIAAIIGAVAFVLSLNGRGSSWFFVFIFFGTGGVSQVRGWLKKRLTHADRVRSGTTQMQADAHDFFIEMAEGDRLADRIHPAVGHALDKCAALAMEIRLMLADPKETFSLREETLRGVDEEMREALVVAQPWVRVKGGRRATFDARAEANPMPPEAVRLEQMSARLRRLHEDLSSALGTPSRGIERVLTDLREQRVAEEELRNGL